MALDAPPAESVVRRGLLEEYGVAAVSLHLLTGGLDRRAWSYRVDREDDGPLVVRLTLAEPAPATYLVPRVLADSGVHAVVAPLPTRDGRLVVRRHGVTWTVSPFVPGTDGWGGRLTGNHWRLLGEALLRIHRMPLSLLPQGIRRDTYDTSAYDDGIRRVDAALRDPAGDPALESLAQVWAAHRDTTMAVLEQLTLLATDLREARRPDVVCHGDLHPGNLLVDGAAVHVVDWDEVVLAPRERDLLFVPELPRGSGDAAGAEAGRDPFGGDTPFFDGYRLDGAGVDWVALAYYRCERVAQDLVSFADDALGPANPPEVRAAAAGWLRHVLQPGGEVDTAVAAARCLPPALDRLRGVRRARASGEPA